MKLKIGSKFTIEGIEMLLYGINNTLDGERYDFQYWNDGRIEHLVISENELSYHIVKEAAK